LVNFKLIEDIVLERTETGHVIVHTEKKIKRKRKARGVTVFIITETYDKFTGSAFSRGGV